MVHHIVKDLGQFQGNGPSNAQYAAVNERLTLIVASPLVPPI
jgi:hypothetical protein